MKRLLFAGVMTAAVLLGKTTDAAFGQPGFPPKGLKSAAHPHNAPRGAYHARGYRNWAGYCWLPKYRCYGYFSPVHKGWFYWYPPMNRFLPIAYLATYPPAVTGVPFAPSTPASGTTTPTPTLPPGGTPIPASTPATPAGQAPAPPADPAPTQP